MNILKTGTRYEKERLDFLSTKDQYLKSETFINTDEQIYINKETKKVLTMSWAIYGKYVELVYKVESIQ